MITAPKIQSGRTKCGIDLTEHTVFTQIRGLKGNYKLSFTRAK